MTTESSGHEKGAQRWAEGTARNSPAAPGRSVVVYDGDCPFCRRQIEWIRARDRRGAFEFLPRQSPDADQRFPRLAEGDLSSGLRVVRPDGRIEVGADGVYRIARELSGWRLLALLYRVPGFKQVSRAAYAWVAARRYRLARACDDGCSPDARPQRGGFRGPSHD